MAKFALAFRTDVHDLKIQKLRVGDQMFGGSQNSIVNSSKWAAAAGTSGSR
jgi:hypothetical protein